MRRLAAGLRALGLRREERVLLLMQDGNDWPVGFLGAMYAGLVPVAVNTLLTADDYAYMLEHSRAQAVLVSGALLPALDRGDGQGGPRGRQGHRLAPGRAAASGEVEFEAFVAAQRAAGQAGRHRRRRPRLLALLVGLHRPAQGHGALARQPLLDRRAVRQGACWA